MHFDSPDTRQWVDNQLTGMLHQMNVEEEYVIAGRWWLSEIGRIIQRGYKVIIVISKNTITISRFEIIIHHIIFRQTFRQSFFIPILFNCTLQDFDDNVKSVLDPYTYLKHDQQNLYECLRNAICY